MTAPITLVASREIRQRVRSRAFAVSTVLIALLVLGIGVLSRVLANRDSAQTATVAVVGAAPPDLATAITQAGLINDVRVTIVDEPDRASADAALRRGDVDAVLVAPDRALEFHTTVDGTLQRTLGAAWQAATAANAASAAGLSQQQIGPIVAPPPLQASVLDPSNDQSVGVLVGIVAAIVLFGAVSAFGGMVLAGVVEEKTTAIVELLLARVRAHQLLAGKVIGIGTVALLQVVAAVIAGVIALAISGASIPAEVWLAVPTTLLWFLGGFALYSTLYALAGSFVSRQEDAQAAAMPVTLVVLAPYLFVFVFASQPDSTAATIASMIPPFAPLLMPLRIATGAAELWQVAMAAVLLAVTIVVVLRVAARIYARTLLQRGARIPWRQAVRLRST